MFWTFAWGEGDGLTGKYFNKTSTTYASYPIVGAPNATRIDTTVNFNWGASNPVSGINVNFFQVQWTGYVYIPTDGTWTFYTQSDDGVKLNVNNQTVIDNWTNHGSTENSGSIYLSEGLYPIKMEYFENGGDAVAQLRWSGPALTKQVIPTANLYSALPTGSNYRNFTPFFQSTLLGDAKMVGNSSMLKSGKVCAGATENNSDVTLVYADMDTDVGTFNSTMARLALPPGVTKEKIRYAGLYWQGRFLNTNNASMPDNARQVKFKPYSQNEGSYITLNSSYLKFNYGFNTAPGFGPYNDYQGVTDITNLIRESFNNVSLSTINSTGFSKEMWVADIQSSTGNNGFAGWSLVVVYENPVSTLKNITLFDGFQTTVKGGTISATLNGFLTPQIGPVKADFMIFGGEGDIGRADSVTLTNNGGTQVSLGNNIFNATVNVNGVSNTDRSPNCTNTIGVDIDTFSVGSSGGNPSIIGNNQTATTVRITEPNDDTWDQIFPGFYGFSTEIYQPKLCYDYSLKQNGQYLSIDRTKTFPVIDQSEIKKDIPIELQIYLKNKEASFIVQSASLRSDLNGTYFGGKTYYLNDKIYVSNPNGSELIDRGLPLLNTPADCNYSMVSGNALASQGCTQYFDNNLSTTEDDILRIRKGLGDIGSQEYIYTKILLHPSQLNDIFDDFNQSLGLTLDYYITAGGEQLKYNDYVLGGANVPMCVPDSAYTPALGLFNVVEHSTTNTPNTSNNLKTKISRKPFDVDVIFDGVPTTWTNDKPTATVSSTVLVEMVDVDAFGDINASCANPDAAVSKAIFVPVTFTNANAPAYQTLVAKQNSDYHNFAVKNGAFRIWYFTDKSNALRDWKPIGLSDANKTITGIDSTGTKLYDAASHPICQSSCSTATSLTCFNCMKTNYAKPLCSRDNFSVRPEAFDIRIKDYNATVVSDLSRDVYGMSPDKNTTTIPATQPQMNLAAGYDYHCDINATGYEQSNSGLVAVPLYTRHFKGMDTSFTAKLLWNSGLSNAVCNDVASNDVTLDIENGRVADVSLSLNQVGQYRMSLMDKSWAKVDQQNRIAGNGFVAGTDCVKDSNSSVLDGINGRYGCDIVSEHTNGSLQYKDQNITFKPAKFDLSSFTYGVGKNNTSVTPGSTKFIYMSNLDNGDEMNMSLRANGKIKAVGANGAMLSNFVTGCFARDLNITIENNATDLNGRVEYRSPANGALIDDKNASLVSATAFKTLDDSNFTKVNNGELNTTIRLNHFRNSTTPRNPQIVVYNDFTTTCSNVADCSMNSLREDINRTTAGVALGKSDMDFTLTHLYGRLFTKDFRGTANTAFDAFTQYEVFKAPTITVDGVNEALTPNAINGDWYINKMHDVEARDGNSSIAFIENGFSLPSTTTYDTNGIKTYHFTGYGTRGNYKTHIDIDPWLWFEQTYGKGYKDPANPSNLDCQTHPCFNIRIGSLIGRSGSADTASESTKDNKNSKSTGAWKSVNDYAPAIR